MKGGLIILLMGTIYLICKKCDCGSNIRAGSSSKTIDTSNDALIYLFLVGKIGVEIINRSYRVNWVTRSIMSHIGDLVWLCGLRSNGR